MRHKGKLPVSSPARAIIDLLDHERESGEEERDVYRRRLKKEKRKREKEGHLVHGTALWANIPALFLLVRSRFATASKDKTPTVAAVAAGALNTAIHFF